MHWLTQAAKHLALKKCYFNSLLQSASLLKNSNSLLGWNWTVQIPREQIVIHVACVYVGLLCPVFLRCESLLMPCMLRKDVVVWLAFILINRGLAGSMCEHLISKCWNALQ